MDERFLSQPDVIKASRNFVCVRMLTYESASEVDVLKSLWRPDAPLENTVFAILDPSGRALVRGGRSPQHVFSDSTDMTARMNEIARYYNSNSLSAPESLPSVATVRLAIDVAACDKRPLAIVVGRNEAEREQLARRLAPIAWSKDYIGKIVYTTGGASELDSVKNVRPISGYVFVAPSLFGTDGTTMVQLDASASAAQLAQAASQSIEWFHPQYLSHHDHVRAGRQNGIDWKTAIPVTDPHSLQAQQMERSRGPGGFGGGPGGNSGFAPSGGCGGPPPFRGSQGYGGQQNLGGRSGIREY